MSNQTVEAIEQNIQRSRADVDLGEALERLRNNKDFKKVVLEGYFEKEAIRLVHLKADPAMQKVESQVSIVQQIDAIGSFASFLNTTLRIAGLAAKSIESDESTLEEIRTEELTNG